jgi:beta-phosphoglucomutase-like phosphatase (HAD superfamily)
MSANPAGCIVIEDWSVGIQGAVAEHTAMADGCRCRCADWQEISRQLSLLGVPA